MEQRDRDIIDFVCEHIINHINIHTLFPILIELKVFYEEDVNVPIWRVYIYIVIIFIIHEFKLYKFFFFQTTLNDINTIEDIVRTVKTRGPHAFKNFVRALRQTDHDSVADILENIKDSIMIFQNSDLYTPHCA